MTEMPYKESLLSRCANLEIENEELRKQKAALVAALEKASAHIYHGNDEHIEPCNWFAYAVNALASVRGDA